MDGLAFIWLAKLKIRAGAFAWFRLATSALRTTTQTTYHMADGSKLTRTQVSDQNNDDLRAHWGEE